MCFKEVRAGLGQGCWVNGDFLGLSILQFILDLETEEERNRVQSRLQCFPPDFFYSLKCVNFNPPDEHPMCTQDDYQMDFTKDLHVFILHNRSDSRPKGTHYGMMYLHGAKTAICCDETAWQENKMRLSYVDGLKGSFDDDFKLLRGKLLQYLLFHYKKQGLHLIEGNCGLEVLRNRLVKELRTKHCQVCKRRAKLSNYVLYSLFPFT